jgi:hypothetical protein
MTESGVVNELVKGLATQALKDARANAKCLGGGPDGPEFLASEATFERISQSLAPTRLRRR